MNWLLARQDTQLVILSVNMTEHAHANLLCVSFTARCWHAGMRCMQCLVLHHTKQRSHIAPASSSSQTLVLPLLRCKDGRLVHSNIQRASHHMKSNLLLRCKDSAQQ